jgi:hypothetical protein
MRREVRFGFGKELKEGSESGCGLWSQIQYLIVLESAQFRQRIHCANAAHKQLSLSATPAVWLLTVM